MYLDMYYTQNFEVTEMSCPLYIKYSFYNDTIKQKDVKYMIICTYGQI